MVAEQTTRTARPVPELLVTDDAVRATYGGPLVQDLTNRQVRETLELGAPVVVADELSRIAALAHEAAQSFDEAMHQVRKDDYLTFARILKERAAALRGGA